MKRHAALHPLSHDHHKGLILAQQLKKGAPQYKGMPSTLEEKKIYTISFYNNELVQHFKDEEEILFPLVKNRTTDIDVLIDEIVDEHRKMEKLVAEIQKTTELETALDALGRLLEKHIRKEERELFLAIEKILSEDEYSQLKLNLNKN